MKKMLLTILSMCFIETQLDMIRPNAKWIVHYQRYDGIEWLDTQQAKPTEEEMKQSICGWFLRSALLHQPLKM